MFMVLVVNLSFLIWTASTHNVSGGIAVLHRGSCTTSAKLDTWFHLGINVLSTALLGGSNYCKFFIDDQAKRWLLSPKHV